MFEITPVQRRYLRGLAHSLNPVVMIGQHGLTDAVIRETAQALDRHELIKIRVLGDDREAREQWFKEICEQLGAAEVQHIGTLLVLYRPADEPKIVLPRG